MEVFATVSTLIGGVVLFLYGMKLASESLELATGGNLRVILRVFTAKPLIGVFAGTAVTVTLSSSSAATVLLVSLADAGLIGLKQSLGVILGSGLGTALVVLVFASVIEFKTMRITHPYRSVISKMNIPNSLPN